MIQKEGEQNLLILLNIPCFEQLMELNFESDLWLAGTFEFTLTAASIQGGMNNHNVDIFSLVREKRIE